MVNKTSIVTTAVLALFVGIVTIALIQNPPTKPAPHNHEEEGGSGQSNVLEAKGDDIDLSKAKDFTFKVKGMNSEEIAGKVNSSLHASFEGFVGKVTADLETGQFTVQYDTNGASEEKILEAIKQSGFEVEAVSAEQSP